MFVLLYIAFHKWGFWWYSKEELVIYWGTCIWRQNRGSVPEGYMLSLPGFVRCPKGPLRQGWRGAAKLLLEESSWVALGRLWEMWTVSELVRRKEKCVSPRGLSVVWLLGKKRGRGSRRVWGDASRVPAPGAKAEWICWFAVCVNHCVVLSSTFAKY